MKYGLFLILLAALFSLGAGPATQPMPLPTPGELKQMHDAGEYRICLQQIARVLQLRGDPARPYDKFALLLLRGDCLLHLGDRTTALEAYSNAGKSTEPAQLAEARATALLIRSSAGLQFTPKPPADGAPIDIANHASRTKAMLALNTQLLADSKPAIDAALDAKNLVPIIAAAPALVDIHSLEVTASGTDAGIHPTLVKIGEKARELMSNELAAVDGRVKAVESMANQPVAVGAVVGAWWWGGATRRGLTSDDRESLRKDAAYADQITSAANEFQSVSRTLGNTGEKWTPVIEKSFAIAQHARDVLAAE